VVVLCQADDLVSAPDRRAEFDSTLFQDPWATPLSRAGAVPVREVRGGERPAPGATSGLSGCARIVL
ncbi:hypothetical protein ACFWFR_11945, partial [Oerskovia sp. NPDC060287]|uniref:hypothetical protein n=1 Tax=Oerskovia sp. NPDC060287 TaxID=3347095 RepID=UPI0036566F19